MGDPVDSPEFYQAVYDVLVAEAGASAHPQERQDFVRYMASHGGTQEWRFCGALGFGGKLWRDPIYPAARGGCYVTYYPEHRTPAREAIVERTNVRLAEVAAGFDPPAE